MTYAVKLQLAILDIRAGRGQYAKLNAVERCLLINDLVAKRKII